MITYNFFTLVCSLLYSFSSVLCKYGLQHDVDIRSLSPSGLALFLAGNKIWLLGVLLAVVANVAMIQIQSRLDVSVVYSILNFSYIFVLIMGHHVLRESLNADQWFGVVVVTMGTLMILGVYEVNTAQPTSIGNLLKLTGTAFLMIALLISTAWHNKETQYEIIYAICAGICFGLVEIYLKATTNMATSEDGSFSILSWQSIRVFLSVWPFFVMFACGAVGWLFLQITYSHGKVSVTMPVVAVIQRIVSIFSGYYVYDELFGLVKIMGVLTILLGISLLVYSTLL
ncbi:MAG: EamA family transporter, partial [Methylococcales bacterium]